MVIGIIIFIILVLINFMVVTKGAGRVAEVQARFSLDSLPGKQMAIDADLNAGFIDDKQAKARREELAAEVSFYGTMDGSAKFVKGDAIAGIIITLVNLIGGLLIGMFQYNMTAGESAEVYTILTIGDGLVAQIPALIISTATAIMITRSNSDEDKFASGTISQLVKRFTSFSYHWYCFSVIWSCSRIPYWYFIYNGIITKWYRLFSIYDGIKSR
jgi:flagellar biosynthesis protein FlhA